MSGELRAAVRYAWGLRGFLGHAVSSAECRDRLRRQLSDREESFLRLLEAGIFARPASPYLPLLRRAGAELGDIERDVRRDGIEAALARLHAEGVYVSLDEFKGRQPIRRPGLELHVGPHDFDNPLLARFYTARSSGSRGAGTRAAIDLDLLTHEAAYYDLFLDAHGLKGRPVASWRELPPGHAGMKLALRFARLGRPLERWFSQSRLSWRWRTLPFHAFTVFTVHASRLFGHRVPMPEHVPIREAWRIAEWLHRQRRAEAPAVMDTNVSSGIRICLAAAAQGLDISGTFFRFGGEPFTDPRAEIVRRAGCVGCCHYSMAEAGTLGIACARPTAPDDVHVLSDKVALVASRRQVEGADEIPALLATTVLPLCPRVMLNVEIGDYGVLEERLCGCAIGALGYRLHLSRIRSFEKLSSEGMSFLGTDLVRLIDEVLPSRFGGTPLDYQLAEEEIDGLPKVHIVISPRVGPVDAESVIRTVVEALKTSPARAMMAERWKQADTLGVRRVEPYVTSSAKVQALHLLDPPRQA